ncbi:MAG: hypothetical protein HDT42_09270 [Ruminococcaceae bacterium]|nr:hypothetical protein [Oscillospiraceae bacterium]
MVKFANGKQLETIAVYGGKQTFQNANRGTLEIQIAAENTTFDELKELYTDSAALSEIEITETGIVQNENGENEEKVITQSLQLNFTLPVELALREIDGAQTWCVKLAQKSEIEIAQERQAEAINDTQLGLIELAAMIGGEG